MAGVRFRLILMVLYIDRSSPRAPVTPSRTCTSCGPSARCGAVRRVLPLQERGVDPPADFRPRQRRHHRGEGAARSPGAGGPSACTSPADRPARVDRCRGGGPGRGLAGTPRARARAPELNPSADDPRPRARCTPPQGRPTGRTTSPPRPSYDRYTPPSSAAVPPPPTASRPPPTPFPCAPTSGPSPDANN